MLWAVALAFPAGVSGQAREERPQMSERAAAAALMDNRLTPERDRALRLATELGPRASAELKAAVIEAAWAELRGETDRPEGSEAIFDYLHAVQRLLDPRAIPFMIEALGTGTGTPNALADLGAAVFPAVLAAVRDPEGFPLDIRGGMMALRFMVEDGSLSGRQLEQVREVARERLSGTQDFVIVQTAVRLALALGDPELRRIVERIAHDREVAEALISPYRFDGTLFGSDHRNWEIQTAQEKARLFLSGGGADVGPFRRRYSPR